MGPGQETSASGKVRDPRPLAGQVSTERKEGCAGVWFRGHPSPVGWGEKHRKEV